MSTNIPEDLMNNVEKNLRKHIKDKKRKKHIYKAAAAIISLFIILPGSALAVAKYNNSILYSQEIDLARENKNITEVNETFKYKDVEFRIKEIVADATGMEVIYDVSDPRYSIDEITFGDKDGTQFTEWGFSLPDPYCDNKEKAFLITLSNAAVDYMRDNPITIKINTLTFNDDQNSNKLFDKVTSLINPKDDLKVDWNLKMQIPMQPIKTLSINKEYALDIGTLKINSLQVGVLKSVFDYNFIPKDKSITDIFPTFSIRLDTDYNIANVSHSYGLNLGETSSNTVGEYTVFGSEDNKGIHGTQEFNSIYYKEVSEIGIRLLNLSVTYDFGNSNIYKIDKNNLPLTFNFNGEEFKLTAIEEKENATEYSLEFNKTNRIFTQLRFKFSDTYNYQSSSDSDDIQFADQSSRDKLHNILVEKIPNLPAIEDRFKIFNTGVIRSRETIPTRASEFIITEGTKSFLYDEEEIIWHK